MVKAAPDNLIGLQDRALLLIGFAGAVRRAELVGLDVADLKQSKAGLHLAADRLALYAFDPELHLDRGAVALSLHFDDHARRDGRHQGGHAFRGRYLAGARAARQRDAEDHLESVRADLRAGVRLLGGSNSWNSAGIRNPSWPLAGATSVIFLGEIFLDNVRIVAGKAAP
jgi:hypothetical protein